jgi:galactose mutarotase-like enzyme
LHPEETIVLFNDDAAAHVSVTGAELTRWRIGETDLLWRSDPAIWERTSPLLFPVVGWCAGQSIKVAGMDYPMPVHGFAASQLFDVEQYDAQSVTLLLRDNEATRLYYPFAFSLRVQYTLSARQIAVALVVVNEDRGKIYYACGLHPGFALPFAGGVPEDYAITFEHHEQPHVPVIAPGGLFARKRRPVPLFGTSLAVNHDLFTQEALCFLHAKSKWISVGRVDHGHIRMDVENFPHLAIWSVPGAPFVSLEAWTGFGDPEGFSGELSQKPGMIALRPGSEGRASAVFTYSGG